MKRGTIEKLIEEKVSSWLASIKDVDLRSFLSDKIIVTGGAISSMLLNEKVNDFDLYFTTKEAATRIAQYYVGQFKQENPGNSNLVVNFLDVDRVRIWINSSGVVESEASPDDAGDNSIAAKGHNVERMDDGDVDVEEEKSSSPTFRPVFISSNAITLSDSIQIVIRFFGDADTIHTNYDFVHCTNYWTSKDKKLVTRHEALEALLAKELRYIGSKYPVCSLVRIRKFLRRGWTINAGQLLKIMFQVHALNLLDPKVLQEQLIGVDSTYFCRLLREVKEKNPDKIDATYIATLIDRMF